MADITVQPRGGWFGIVSSTVTAVVVGFASTILLIMEAARAVGANPAQQASPIPTRWAPSWWRVC